jgi:hypothetical protein
MSATSAIAATPQGSEVDNVVRGAVAAAPAGVPHRWQNLAPGVSGAEHAPHVAPASDAPQFEQNLPTVSAPQVGHFTAAAGADGGEAMR